MNLIDQAKTLMQGCGKKEINILFNKPDNVSFCGKEGFLCDVCKAKASQMLIDLTNEKEFLDNITDLDREEKIEIGEILFELIINRLKEINSAIEILGGNK